MKKVYNVYNLKEDNDWPIESFGTMREAEEFVDWKESNWPSKYDCYIRCEYE